MTTVVIEQELGKSIKIVEGLGPGVAGRYEVNVDGTSLVVDGDGILSTAFSIVFIDTEDPLLATIFSNHFTPALSDPRLAAKPYKIYRTPSGSSYIYDVDPTTYFGNYLRLGQATISEWRVSGLTSNSFNLPYVSPNNRIMLFINGVHYDDSQYTLSAMSVVWAGSFNIEPYDMVKILFI
jgi:hypothetical protein